MKTAKFLFGAGVTVLFVQFIGTILMISRMSQASMMMNWGSLLYSLAGSFVGGGTLIGLSKIIEKLYAPKA